MFLAHAIECFVILSCYAELDGSEKNALEREPKAFWPHRGWTCQLFRYVIYRTLRAYGAWIFWEMSSARRANMSSFESITRTVHEQPLTALPPESAEDPIDRVPCRDKSHCNNAVVLIPRIYIIRLWIIVTCIYEVITLHMFHSEITYCYYGKVRPFVRNVCFGTTITGYW